LGKSPSEGRTGQELILPRQIYHRHYKGSADGQIEGPHDI
jgi:hypothetical protein